MNILFINNLHIVSQKPRVGVRSLTAVLDVLAGMDNSKVSF